MYKYIQPSKPDEIYHYGIKRRSGRYPWGSGDRPYQSMSLSEKKDTSISNIKKDEEHKERTFAKGSTCYAVKPYKGYGKAFFNFSEEVPKGKQKYVTKMEVKVPSTEKLYEMMIERYMKSPVHVRLNMKEYRERTDKYISASEARKKMVSNPNEVMNDILKNITSDEINLKSSNDAIRMDLIRNGYNALPDPNGSSSVYLLMPWLDKVE